MYRCYKCQLPEHYPPNHRWTVTTVCSKYVNPRVQQPASRLIFILCCRILAVLSRSDLIRRLSRVETHGTSLLNRALYGNGRRATSEVNAMRKGHENSSRCAEEYLTEQHHDSEQDHHWHRVFAVVTRYSLLILERLLFKVATNGCTLYHIDWSWAT